LCWDGNQQGGAGLGAASAALFLLLQHGMESSCGTRQLSSDNDLAEEQRSVKGEKKKTPAAPSANSLFKNINRYF